MLKGDYIQMKASGQYFAGESCITLDILHTASAL